MTMRYIHWLRRHPKVMLWQPWVVIHIMGWVFLLLSIFTDAMLWGLAIGFLGGTVLLAPMAYFMNREAAHLMRRWETPDG